MRWWCFTLIAVLSSVLFIATGALWMRSYVRGWDCLEFFTGKHLFLLQTTHAGLLDIAFNDFTALAADVKLVSSTPRVSVGTTNGFDKLRASFLGVGVGWPRSGSLDYYWVRVPLWLIMLANLFVMLGWILLFRRLRNAIKPGMCTKCGYDLRASKDRCPECGTAIVEEQPGPTAA